MFLFVGLIDVIFWWCTHLPASLLRSYCCRWCFCESTGRYFLWLILPLKGLNLHYGCIYLNLALQGMLQLNVIVEQAIFLLHSRGKKIVTWTFPFYWHGYFAKQSAAIISWHVPKGGSRVEMDCKARSNCFQGLEYHCPEDNEGQGIHRSQCQQPHIATRVWEPIGCLHPIPTKQYSQSCPFQQA